MPEPRNLFQRINNVRKAVSYIQKTKGGGLSYSVISHDMVTAKLRPHMIEQGLVYYPTNMKYAQVGNRTEVKLDLKIVNEDNPEEFIFAESLGYGVDGQDKGPGKAISYATKMALLKVFALETGEDPDLTQDETADFNPFGNQNVVASGNNMLYKGTEETDMKKLTDFLKEVTKTAKNSEELKEVWEWNKSTIEKIKKEVPESYDELVKFVKEKKKSFTEKEVTKNDN